MAGQGKMVKSIILNNIAEIFGINILVRHPDTRGIKNDEFEFVGHWVRKYGEFNFDRDFSID